MSPFFVKAIQLLMSLSFLIILHELGHFIPARIFKTRVEKFFLFFDVKFALFQKKLEKQPTELDGSHWEVMSKYQE